MVWKRNEVMKQENRLDSDESRRFLWSGQWESNPPPQLGRLIYQPMYDARIFYFAGMQAVL